jgi:hypothetical protein
MEDGTAAWELVDESLRMRLEILRRRTAVLMWRGDCGAGHIDNTRTETETETETVRGDITHFVH